MVNDKYLLILVQNGSEWSIIVLSRSNIGVRPFYFLHTVDMRGRFFSSDRPWGERSAPGAEVSKGTSPRAVDADMLDIDSL